MIDICAVDVLGGVLGELSANVAHEFGLVPDNHQTPKWYKIVVMEHVEVEHLAALAEAIKEDRA